MTASGAFGWCVSAWGLAHGVLFLAGLLQVWQSEPLAAGFSLATRGLVSGASLVAVGLTLWRVDCPSHSLRKALAFTWPHWSWIAVSAAMVAPLHCALGGPSEWPPEVARATFEIGEVAGASRPQVRGLAAAAGVCLISPMAEEFFFRGVLLGRMGGTATTRVGLTALFFAMMHNQLPAWPSLFAVGVILGILRVASQSLLPALILHCSYNTMVLAGNPLTLRLESMMSEGQRIAVGASLVVGLLVLSYLTFQKLTAPAEGASGQ